MTIVRHCEERSNLILSDGKLENLTQSGLPASRQASGDEKSTSEISEQALAMMININKK